MPILQSIADEIGLSILSKAPRDAHLLILQRGFRLVAYGQSTLVLVQYLNKLNISDFRIGLFMTLTLVGDVLGSLVLTLFADKWGRRKVLTIGCGLMVSSGLVFCTSGSYFILLLAAIFGVISPSGNEIGPFKAIEESTLATLIPKEHRSTIFAWYGLFSAFSASLGSLTAGHITQYLQNEAFWSEIDSYRFVFAMYAMWGIIKGGLTLLLSDRCEVDGASAQQKANPPGEENSRDGTADQVPLLERGENGQPAPIPKEPPRNALGLTQETKEKVITLGLLFGLDNTASGLVPLSFVIYYFSTRFSLDPGTLGTTFFTTSVVAALSNLVAASLSRRIGNVKTMAFTHLPSAVFLSMIPLASTFTVARALLIARFCTAQMDGAPRSAFLANYIPDKERTSVMGIINVVKTICQSFGPSVTGYLAGRGWIRFSFMAAGAMKASYDLMILYFFSKASIQ
ncbi:major facilitator superfamily domain-containing protein [Kockovaella imperatae]|uniref:Major facilitator superfamily domain-containing protein n=1 Tax=Kockovaella imperatae TaxID=4999 RepID=A0A1Y1UNS9_9TREE|nr:major facilitator superfamily domain-containing protein [Kockovaella imperatae]ORX39700.1 major facilitator superfamily domain-containing protein [Kockovaella imperatae]